MIMCNWNEIGVPKVKNEICLINMKLQSCKGNKITNRPNLMNVFVTVLRY